MIIETGHTYKDVSLNFGCRLTYDCIHGTYPNDRRSYFVMYRAWKTISVSRIVN